MQHILKKSKALYSCKSIRNAIYLRNLAYLTSYLTQFRTFSTDGKDSSKSNPIKDLKIDYILSEEEKKAKAWQALDDSISECQEAVKKLYSEGKYTEAIERALEARDKTLSFYGEHHAIYASIQNNLALLYKCIGDFDQSEKCYKKAIEIYEDVAGSNNSSTLTCLNNLGLLYKLKAEKERDHNYHHNLQLAESLIVEVFNRRYEQLSSNNPILAQSYRTMGNIERLLGKYEESEKHLFEALRIVTHCYGENHRETALVFNDIGMFFTVREQYDKAEHYYKRSLEIRTQLCGEGHHDTISTKNNLAELYIHMGKIDDATKIQNELIETIEKYYGEDSGKSLPLPPPNSTQSTQTTNTQNNKQKEIVNNKVK